MLYIGLSLGNPAETRERNNHLACEDVELKGKFEILIFTIKPM